jgi:hypothetical protein
MFGSLTKLADKAFVVGFLLPTLMAALAFLYLFNDVEPFSGAYKAALSIKEFSELSVAAIIVWALASLLMMWNEWLYRFLEGYVGPFNNEGMRERARDRMTAAQADLKIRETLIADKRKTKTATDEETRVYLKALRDFFARYPVDAGLVLPTRFGNVLRAFETYPRGVYGIEAIPTWLRLQGVVPKDYAALVNDARSTVDFFVNGWFLAVLLGVSAIARTVFALNVNCCGQSAVGMDPKFAWIAALSFGAAWIAYGNAVATAITWGDSVKAAFDLYLPAMAAQLGYGVPKNEDERREFWDEVSSLFLYRQTIAAGRWPVESAAVTAQTGAAVGTVASVGSTGSAAAKPAEEAKLGGEANTVKPMPAAAPEVEAEINEDDKDNAGNGEEPGG